MHKKDILVIRLGVAVAAVARKHHLTAEGLQLYLKQLFPALDDGVLKRAATLGAEPPVG